MTTRSDVARSHFRWVAGVDKLSAYESSPGKFRRFCSVCGTLLISERPDKPLLFPRVATLDDDPGQTPQYHIWASQQPKWLVEAPGAAHYDEWEPSH